MPADPRADADPAVVALLAVQCGVISRRQALELGLTPGDLERRLRRREWVRLLPGVFVDHTGVPTWRQRAWAGVLRHEPAALARESALRAAIGPAWQDTDAPIRLIVPAARHLAAAPGYHLTRCRSFDTTTQPTTPPRQRVEEAVLDAAVESGHRTVRLGWGQVFDRPCRTAARVGVLLREVGWAGEPRRCPACP